MKCPICNSKNRSIISKYIYNEEQFLDYYSDNIFWFKCQGCDTVYSSVCDLGKNPFAQIYESEYRSKESFSAIKKRVSEIINLPEDKSEAFERIDYLKSVITSTNADIKKILDFAGGLGVNAYFMEKILNIKSVVVDKSTQARVSCEDLNIKFAHNLNDLNFDERKFDMVFLGYFLEHLISPISFLKQLFKEINDINYLYVEVPDLSCFTDPSSRSMLIKEHFIFFSQNSVQSMLRKLNFRILRSTVTRARRGHMALKVFAGRI